MHSRLATSSLACIAGAGALTGVTSAPFSIAKPTATLRIPAATSGSSFDSDGYTACVDPASDGQGGTSCGYGGPLAVGVNGTALVTVDTGAHAVLLTGVAGNCAVAGDNPRTVHARRGETAEVPFAITCAEVTLHVTTTEDVIWIPGMHSGVEDRVAVYDAVPDQRKALVMYQGGSHSIFTDRPGPGGPQLHQQIKSATRELALAFMEQSFGKDASALQRWDRSWRALVAQSAGLTGATA